MLYCCYAYSVKEGLYGNSRLKVRKKEKNNEKDDQDSSSHHVNHYGIFHDSMRKESRSEEVFDAAVKKNSELTSLDMDTTMKMTMTQGEETMDITVDMNMKMSNMNEDSMQYLADTKLP